MGKQKILYSSAFVLIVVAFVNYFGCKFDLYWTYRWLDIPVHMLGGLSVGLAALWLWVHSMHLKVVKTFRMKALGVVIFSILLVGISWELFELWGGITDMSDKGYWFDTIKDLLDDSVGAMIAYFIFIKTKKPEKEPVVISAGNNIN